MLIAPEILKHPLQLTIISDRQKGLIEAVDRVVVGCNQRYCFRHMYHNMKSKHRGKDICHKSRAAAKTYKKSIFEKRMVGLWHIDPRVRDWLKEEHPKLWARSYLDIKGRQSMKGDLVPRALDRINELTLEIGKFEIEGCDDGDLSYTVMKGARNWQQVSLTQKTCTCEAWQLSGIPCAHAVRVIQPLRLSFRGPFVSVELYKKAYNGRVKPFLPQNEWSEPSIVVAPPAYKRPARRPRKNRRKAFDERGRQGQPKKRKNCGRCGMGVHNRRTCKNPPKENGATSQPSQQKGRMPGNAITNLNYNLTHTTPPDSHYNQATSIT